MIACVLAIHLKIHKKWVGDKSKEHAQTKLEALHSTVLVPRAH
jgi:hypothetical protein